jgi:hypothetical protein
MASTSRKEAIKYMELVKKYSKVCERLAMYNSLSPGEHHSGERAEYARRKLELEKKLDKLDGIDE